MTGRRRKPFARLVWGGRRETRLPSADLELRGEAYPAESDDGQAGWGGRLILGDNLAVMDGLMPELEGRIDLIYADPPFLTGKAYAARVGRGEDSRRPSEWRTAHGYQDVWQGGESYLNML
jgi:hypothetical protein